MKIKFIKAITAIILIISISKFCANIFLGKVDINLFHHVFFNILWIIALVGLYKIQKWGRTLILFLSGYYIFLITGFIIASLFSHSPVVISLTYMRGLGFSILCIVVLNLKSIKELFVFHDEKERSMLKYIVILASIALFFLIYSIITVKP